ncbi:MAG: Flp1 family type IVb pilin [Bdellovibrionales bacterium]
MRKFIKQLWQDESAQGTSEYILLLVAIIAVAMLFKDKIRSVIEGKMGEVGSSIEGFK